MSEAEIIKALIAAIPAGAVIVIVAWLVKSGAPTIIEKATALRAEVNKGDKERAEIIAQANTELVKMVGVLGDKYAQGMKDNLNDSRTFWAGEVEKMRAEIKVLEGRVGELEEQVDDKDHRIEELERENATLRREVDTLRARLDKTQERRPAQKKAKAA